MNNSYINHNCPPLMADGRHVTDYRPSCETHSSIRYLNGIYDSNEFRQFLQHNSNKLRQMTRQFYDQKNNCQSCQFIHPDPNHNDTFWAFYRKQLYSQPTYSMHQGGYQTMTY